MQVIGWGLLGLVALLAAYRAGQWDRRARNARRNMMAEADAWERGYALGRSELVRERWDGNGQAVRRGPGALYGNPSVNVRPQQHKGGP